MSAQRVEATVFHPFQNMFQTIFGGLDTLALNMEPAVKGMACWQLEMVGLMSRRAQAYLEIPSALSRCRTPQDLLKEQAHFMQVAMQQYTESSRRLAAAVGQMASVPPAFGLPAERRAKRDYIRLPESKAPAAPKSAPARERRVA